MKQPQRSERARRAYEQGNPLLARNRARRLGSALDALRAGDRAQAMLAADYGALPVSTLGDYQAMNEVAGALIDQDREPYLVNRELLELGMHPFQAVWDIGRQTTKVARGGRSFFTQEMATVVVSQGDALLPLDTVLVWR